MIGRVHTSPPHRGFVVRRGQAERLLGELRGARRCAAGARMPRCGLEFVGGDGIRAYHRKGEVSRAGLRAGHDLSQPRVQRAPLGRRCLCQDRRGEQGMGKAKPLAFHLEHAGLQRLRHTRRASVPCRRLDDGDARLRDRGHDERYRPRLRTEAVDVLLHERLQRGRKRQLRAGLDTTAASLERACEFEREEGVAVRRLPETEQHRSGKPHAEAILEQAVERADT